MRRGGHGGAAEAVRHRRGADGEPGQDHLQHRVGAVARLAHQIAPGDGEVLDAHRRRVVAAQAEPVEARLRADPGRVGARQVERRLQRRLRARLLRAGDVGVGEVGRGHPRLGGAGDEAVTLGDELRDRRPELRARALLRERQRRQVLAGGDLPQQSVAVAEPLGRGDRLRGGDVHDVDHRRRGAAARELLDDGAEGARPLGEPAELARDAETVEARGGDRRQALLGKAGVLVDVRGVARERAVGERDGLGVELGRVVIEAVRVTHGMLLRPAGRGAVSRCRSEGRGKSTRDSRSRVN